MRGNKTEWAPGRWRLRVYIGKDGRGKPIQESRNFSGGSRAADKALRDFVHEVEKARNPDRVSTISDVLDAWLEHTGSERTRSTLRNYKQVVESDLKPAFGTIPLDRLRPHTLDEQYRRWRDAGLKPASIRQRHAIMSAALRQAVKWEWLEEAVTAKASPPVVRREERPTVTLEELRRILDAAEEDDPVHGTAFALAALLGARRGDLCALRWSAVDLGARTVRITSEKTHTIRTIPLDPVATGTLGRRWAYQTELAARAGTRLVQDSWVLSRRADGGEQMKADGLTHAFARICADLHLSYRLHDLRHFAATTMIAAGVDARTAANRLGHANPTMTLNVYSHLVDDRARDAADVLGRAVQMPVVSLEA